MLLKLNQRLIDCIIDFVFKYLLGCNERSHLTLHFLNAVMRQLGRPEFRDITILNPYKQADNQDGKDIVLDVHALVDGGQEVQIEMQVQVHAELPDRMLDNWTRLYSRQLKKGQGYQEHKPAYALWIVNEGFRDSREVLRVFELRDQHGQLLSQHQNIIVIDLAAWRTNLRPGPETDILDTDLAKWLELFGSQATFDPETDPPKPRLKLQ